MNQRTELKLGFSYFIRNHISYRLHWFGGVIVEYTARVLNPTFHWLFRQDKDHSFLQVWAQEAHMVIMSRAFVFLNCDIGIERVIIRGNEGHHMPLSNMVLQLVREMNFGNHVVMRI